MGAAAASERNCALQNHYLFLFSSSSRRENFSLQRVMTLKFQFIPDRISQRAPGFVQQRSDKLIVNLFQQTV